MLNHGLEWADPHLFRILQEHGRPLTSEADPSGMYNSIEYLYIGLLNKTFGFFYCIIIVG